MTDETEIKDAPPDVECDDDVKQAPFEVLYYTNPILSKPSNKVMFVDDELRKVIEDMAETMMVYDGIGLAAPQVGICKRFFLFVSKFQHDEDTIEINVAINPVVIEEEGESITYEGCLSYPDYFAHVKRAIKIKVRYQDIDLNKVEEELTGLAARVFQHELDHLEGIQFIDRMLPDTLKHKDEIDKEEEKKRTGEDFEGPAAI